MKYAGFGNMTFQNARYRKCMFCSFVSSIFIFGGKKSQM